MYLILVKGFNLGTKNLARMYVVVFKADCLCTLQSPYIVTGLVLTGFTDLSVSFDIMLESSRFSEKITLKNGTFRNFVRTCL